MHLHSFPNTNFKVSALCLGTMTFGTPVGEADSISLTHAAIERGVNFIDTANMYEGYKRTIGSPGGVAEDILGKALLGRRDQVVVATKVGMKIGPSDEDMGLSRKHVFRECDRSLARLQTSWIDLFYMHKPDPAVPLEESLGAFVDLIQAGKIRHYGISNFKAEQIQEVLDLCTQHGWPRPAALQPAYSYLKRDIEAAILPLCQRENIAVIPYKVLEGGVLTGKYRRGTPIPAYSRQVEKPEWTLPLGDDLYSRLEQCENEARGCGRSLVQHALRYLLDQPQVLSLIVGVKTIEQLDGLIEAVS
jgi:aryl-alcohol dehydrogenase-like predicted oxidoreductase